jgi:four helix bundle protein
MKSHKDLNVWKASMSLVSEIYRMTAAFPKQEMFGLSSQMRRAAISIPSNIAEGAARKSTREFVQFLYIAQGSLSELETQCLISEDLGYFSKESEKEIESRIVLIRFQIQGLIKALIRKPLP